MTTTSQDLNAPALPVNVEKAGKKGGKSPVVQRIYGPTPKTGRK